jgi:hypothetical protein
MKTAKEVFQDAAALVEDGWTQGHMARDADGDMADALGDRATCWCALGALYRAVGDDGDLFRNVSVTLARQIGTAVPIWNDAPDRTQAEVIAALRRAAQEETTK